MNTTRRDLLEIIVAGTVITGAGMQLAKAQSAPSPKALVFDTFGTVVNWRGSIIAEGNARGKSKGITVDWGHFADRWREGYGPSMDKVRKGQMPWTGLPWDPILGAELARHYKPDREAYLTSVDLLGLKPEETMMCAAHRGDLNAARSFGLRTGFIHRPNQYGPSRKGDTANPGDFDVAASDILDLAAKLGA